MPRAVFILRDAGETFALLPVLRELRTAEKMSAIAVVTGYGTAPSNATEEAGVITLASLGVHDVSPALRNRSTMLNMTGLHAALARLNPSVLVTGLVSAVQIQLALACDSCGDAVVGYQDGFSLVTRPDDWSARSLADSAIRHAWAVSPSIASSLCTFAAAPTHQTCDAVGSPSNEAWPAAVRSCGIGALAQLRRTTFGIRPSVPLVVFFGGYGQAAYEEAVRTFALGLAALQRTEIPPPAAAFSPHPGNFSSATERRIFTECNATVRVVNEPAGGGGSAGVSVQPALLAAMANLSASTGSTTGIQSLYVGTPAVYIVRSGPSATGSPNIAVRAGLIHDLRTVEAVVGEWAALKKARFRVNSSRLAALGVPNHSVARIVQRVRKLSGS
jgi:hypothetical protein